MKRNDLASDGSTRRTITLAGAVIILVTTSMGFFFQGDGDYFLKVNKSIDVFGRVYREVTSNYVDQVDPEKFMQAGIEGMLGTLDPYTIFLDQSDGEEVDLITNGKYGGIGITISVRDGAVRVVTVLEGYSAQRQGILPGDRLLEVNDAKITASRTEDVRSLTRGEPGTEVRVLVEREGEPKPILFVLIREEIQLKNVTYSGVLEDGIGYIRLERFSRPAGDEVRQAIKELKVKGELKGIILDLRGNPGGLLDAAVDVASKFLPRGSLIVSTRGRKPETERQFLSTEEPLLPETPLVILTDRNSASASEIVGGAVQDLDRGLIFGTRTFGKGLVQTIVPLNHGAQLKITTSRYYIPSGRSIQERDYIHRDRNGVFTVVPDSLRKSFKTRTGRTVFELGGITPDSTILHSEAGPLVRELHRKSYFFRFAAKYAGEGKQENLADITPEIFDAFKNFLKENQFDYQEEAESKLKDLSEIIEKGNYGKAILDDLGHVSELLAKERARGCDRYRDEIERELYIELMARLNGSKGRIEAAIKEDVQVKSAISVMRNRKLYAAMLQGKSS